MLTQCDKENGCGTIYPSSNETCTNCGASTVLLGGNPQLSPKIFIYDIETYPNIFTLAIYSPFTGFKELFEISDRKNQLTEICMLMNKYVFRTLAHSYPRTFVLS